MSRWFVVAMAYLYFLPLWLIVIATDVWEACEERLFWKSPVMYVIYAIVALIAVSLFVVYFNFRGARSSHQPFRRTVVSFYEEKTKCAEFVITYILPFVGFDCKTFSGLIVLLILFVVIASVYARHFYWQTNVVLDWLGYSLYKCVTKDENGDTSRCFVLTRGTLSGCRNRTLAFYQMNDDKMDGNTYLVDPKEGADNETP
jgi:hypothetical protein